MNTQTLAQLTDLIPTDRLVELAQDGNMHARQALVIRRQQAEEALSLHCFRQIAGPQAVERMWSRIHGITAALSKIGVVGKAGVAKQADAEELLTVADRYSE